MSPNPKPDYPTDADVDAVMAEFEQNWREAIKALLHDMAVLAEDGLAEYGPPVQEENRA